MKGTSFWWSLPAHVTPRVLRESACKSIDLGVQSYSNTVLLDRSKILSFLSSQAVSQQLEQAQQGLSSASGEEDKAKAQIAVECLDALNKALGHWR